MARIIDPHLHLFNLEQGCYGWLRPENPPFWPDKGNINRSFSEQNLRLPEGIELAGFVHIEAGFDNQAPWRELAWLETHCNLPFRSVAYADLQAEIFRQQISHLQRYPSLTGIRYILEANPQELLAQAQAIGSLAYLAEQNLLFEAQFSLADLRAVAALEKILIQHPDLCVVINHAGFPTENAPLWRQGVERLSGYPNCAVKCSGWEMADRHWRVTDVQRYIDYLLAQWGNDRVMLASNFPVSELACSYSALWQSYMETLSYSAEQKQALTFANAQRIYQVPVT